MSRCLALGFLLLFAALPGCTFAGSIRDAEIAECRSGEIATWQDGRDRPVTGAVLLFAYRHDGAPPWFERAEVEKRLAQAVRGWAPCGVPVATATDGSGAIVVQWTEAGSRGNFGLANLGQRTLSLGPSAFGLLHSHNPGHDALQTLQMVISHEMGHFFGLIAHSRRCVDVLSYYDAAGAKCFTRNPAGMPPGVEYRSILPTACDIARCRAVNRLD